MTPKTDITESEWLSVLGGEQNRASTPPIGGKLIEDLASIWNVCPSHAGRIVRDRIHKGEVLATKVGRRTYYTIVKGKAKTKC